MPFHFQSIYLCTHCCILSDIGKIHTHTHKITSPIANWEYRREEQKNCEKKKREQKVRHVKRKMKLSMLYVAI